MEKTIFLWKMLNLNILFKFLIIRRKNMTSKKIVFLIILLILMIMSSNSINGISEIGFEIPIRG